MASHRATCDLPVGAAGSGPDCEQRPDVFGASCTDCGREPARIFDRTAMVKKVYRREASPERKKSRRAMYISKSLPNGIENSHLIVRIMAAERSAFLNIRN